jgi:hypothetical protein
MPDFTWAQVAVIAIGALLIGWIWYVVARY